jgi:hypothetical protein
VPSSLFVRSHSVPPTAQPAATIPRVSGRASLVFYGGDPEEDRPLVGLEREVSPGSFAPVMLQSGRPLGSRGRDILLTYTPDPINAPPEQVKSHLWAVEWQAVHWDRRDGLYGVLAVPLGRYRFVVHGRADGHDYQLQSSPFAVVAEGAVAVAASRSGSSISGRAVYPVGRGFRLLRPTGDSSGDVPVSGAVSIELTSNKDGSSRRSSVMLGDGQFTVDSSGLDASAGLRLVLHDADQNSGQKDLP